MLEIVFFLFKIVIADLCGEVNVEKNFFPRIIWSFWEREDNLYEDVKEMIDVSKSFLENFTSIFLTSRNITNFLEYFPNYYKSSLTSGQKGDYVRICLIEKFGGIYMDAATYVHSGNTMEWVVCEAVKCCCEIIGWRGKYWPLNTAFYGAVFHSQVMKSLKVRYNAIMEERNPLEFVMKLCSKWKRRFKWCFAKEHINVITELFLFENPEAQRKILSLPGNTIFTYIYRAYNKQLKRSSTAHEALKTLLVCDPDIFKSFPIVKISHKHRNGKRFGVGNKISEGCVNDLLKFNFEKRK